MKNKENKIEKGFTIVELVITIFVLAFAVVGVYNAFSLAVVLTTGSSDSFTAAYLAQEGIEIVRNIRDTNWLNDADWMTGLYDDSTDCTTGCEADYTTMGTVISLLTPWSDTGNYLNVNEDGFYSYNETYVTQTKFRRKITITQKPFGAIHVSSEVIWAEKANILNPIAQDNSIEVEEDLYNWY